ncbi:unnamed protein product [Jaminaea pallidilutea]
MAASSQPNSQSGSMELPEPDHSHLIPSSAEGDRSGLTFSRDGQLLIGGLSIDGSAAGEAGWASPPPQRYGQIAMKGDRNSRGARLFGRGPSDDAEKQFVACMPREGEPTFGKNAQSTAESTVSQEHQSDALPTSSSDGNIGRRSRLWRKKPAKPSKETQLPVTLADVVEGRTCRPIALIDLRTYLVAKRDSDDFSSANLSLEALQQLGTSSSVTLDANSSNGFDLSMPDQAAAAGELDALNFVVAFDRYTRGFRALPPKQREQCLLPPQSTSCEKSDGKAASVAGESSFSVSTMDISQQPMREQFNCLVSTYLGDLPSSVYPLTSDTSAAPGTHLRAKFAQLTTPLATAPAKKRSRRLDWMVDLGLVDEKSVSAALAGAAVTTNPSILLPIVNAVSSYLDVHVMPGFMSAASRNLSKNTSRTRVMIGVGMTSLALLLSVLLIVDPSPLSGDRSIGGGPPGRIPRWYRIFLLPLWGVAFGYFISSWYGVCVWLSLRGDRERSSKGMSSLTQTQSIGQSSTHSSAQDNTKMGQVPGEETLEEKVGKEGEPAPADQSRGTAATAQRSVLPILPKAVLASEESKTGESSDPSSTALAEMPSVPSDWSTLKTTAQKSPLSPVSEDSSSHQRTDTFDSALPPLSSTGRPLAEPLRAPAAGAALPDGSLIDAPPGPQLVLRTVSVLPGVEIKLRTVAQHPNLSRPSSFARSSSMALARTSSAAGTSADDGPSHPVSMTRLEEGHLQAADRNMGGKGNSVTGAPSIVDRVMQGVQRYTGMAVGTEKVKDETIRRIHQWRAYKAIALVISLSVVVTVVIVAIP